MEGEGGGGMRGGDRIWERKTLGDPTFADPTFADYRLFVGTNFRTNGDSKFLLVLLDSSNC
jgi:hypothetical protein